MNLRNFIPFSRKKDRELTDLSKRGHYWSEVKIQFRKNKLAVWSWRIIQVLIVIALLSDFLANEKPIVANYEGKVYFPILKSYAVDAGIGQWQKELQRVDWHQLDYDWVIRAPIPYSPTNMDKMNDRYTGPFDEQIIASNYWRHWMGTDQLGRDVLSGMIHGTRIALVVGIFAMLIAGIIGLVLGAAAGFYGDDKLKISRAKLILLLVFGFMGIFIGFGSRTYVLSDSLEHSTGAFLLEFIVSLLLFGAFSVGGYLLSKPFSKIPGLSKTVSIPVDIMVMRLIDVLLSIPTLFLIISIIALVQKPNLFVIMAIIGLTGWTGIARLVRAELLRIRNLEYVEAAQALGYSRMRTIVYHALPNALSPVLVALAFGIAGAILIEAFLSFLGLLAADVVTWGSLLSEARSNPSAWWLAIFPGLAIFITVTVYNLVGEGLTDALDPRRGDLNN